MKCQWCGHVHERLCPWVKAIEHFPGGTKIKRVEFKDGYASSPDYRSTPITGSRTVVIDTADPLEIS